MRDKLKNRLLIVLVAVVPSTSFIYSPTARAKTRCSSKSVAVWAKQQASNDDTTEDSFADTVMLTVREGRDPEDVELPTIDVDGDLEDDLARSPQFGVWSGIDDPRDAAWRMQAEDIIHSAVGGVGDVELYDITWNIAALQVVITRPSSSSGDISDLGLDDIVAVNRAIVDALEPHEDDLNILGRHELEVSTRGAPDVLTTEREFLAFKGFDVVVSFSVPDGTKPRGPLEGRLVGRDVHETTINVKGRSVRVPNYMCGEVRLPTALREDQPEKLESTKFEKMRPRKKSGWKR